MKILRKALFLVLALSFPRAVLAWSANGHKTIALIAQSRLSDEAKAAVASILGPTVTLEDIASCADEIRGKRGFDCAGLTLDAEPQSQSWHFIDIPIADSPTGGSALEAYCPAGACVVDQIRAAIKQLRGVSTMQVDANARQVALMFLVHFVGDEHQPLHCSHEIMGGASDRGANTKKVVFEGTPLNLHALWDHQIEAADTNDPVATSQRLIADLDGKDISSWIAGDFIAQSALESFDIAKSTVYPAYYAFDPKSLGDDYQAQMKPIVDERLERAGVRLAALLEAALVPPPAPLPFRN